MNWVIVLYICIYQNASAIRKQIVELQGLAAIDRNSDHNRKDLCQACWGFTRSRLRFSATKSTPIELGLASSLGRQDSIVIRSEAGVVPKKPVSTVSAPELLAASPPKSRNCRNLANSQARPQLLAFAVTIATFGHPHDLAEGRVALSNFAQTVHI